MEAWRDFLYSSFGASFARMALGGFWLVITQIGGCVIGVYWFAMAITACAAIVGRLRSPKKQFPASQSLVKLIGRFILWTSLFSGIVISAVWSWLLLLRDDQLWAAMFVSAIMLLPALWFAKT